MPLSAPNTISLSACRLAATRPATFAAARLKVSPVGEYPKQEMSTRLP